MKIERRILLISSSMTPAGFLQHCREDLSEFLSGVERIAFIPYALKDHDKYEQLAADYFWTHLGKDLLSVHKADDPRVSLRDAEGIFVGGGNTCVLLDALKTRHLEQVIRDRVDTGAAYVGCGAGVTIVSPTIKTAMDMPVVEPQSFDALDLIPFYMNPHYYKAPLLAPHMGESRDEGIREFQEYNDVPVVALYEDSTMSIVGSKVYVLGGNGARVCVPRRDVVDVPAGSRLDELLSG